MTDADVYGVIPEDLWSQPEVSLAGISELDGIEPIQRVRLPASMTYDYIPGLAPTRFLRGLAEKKIFGEKSAQLGDVYVPPRGMSPAEGLPTSEQVELPHKGSVASFCVVHIGFGTNAPPTPFCTALVLLDGASVSVYGPIQEIPYDQVRIGMRVEPVWVDDDQLAPSFESIKWWRPIDEPDVPAESLKGHM